MPKKKYVPNVPDEKIVAGIGNDVDLNSLPVTNVNEALTKDAAQKQKRMELLRAGVKDIPPPETIDKNTSRTYGEPMSDRNYNKAPEPFIADAPTKEKLKSMSHKGTIRERK